MIDNHNEERLYKAMVVEETSKEHQKKDEFPFRRLKLITLTSHIILILQPTNKTYLCFPIASSSWQFTSVKVILIACRYKL